VETYLQCGWNQPHIPPLTASISRYTDKKEKKIFLQSGVVAKSYMRKSFLIYEEMRKYFPIYEEAVSHI
jgi:hypothetical protein